MDLYDGCFKIPVDVDGFTHLRTLQCQCAVRAYLFSCIRHSANVAVNVLLEQSLNQ